MTAEAHRESVGGSERLPPSELAARLDRILAAGERMIALVPHPQAGDGSHGRDRTARQVAYLMFRDSLAFADAMDMGRLPPEWLQANMPRDLRDGSDVARYGALVRARLSGWFEGAAPAEYSRTIDTDRGLETGHALLERTMQGAAERLQQLRALIDDFGLRPDDKP
jgi:hypothetical protein